MPLYRNIVLKATTIDFLFYMVYKSLNYVLHEYRNKSVNNGLQTVSIAIPTDCFPLFQDISAR